QSCGTELTLTQQAICCAQVFASPFVRKTEKCPHIWRSGHHNHVCRTSPGQQGLCYSIVYLPECRDGGTGRRSGLKMKLVPASVLPFRFHPNDHSSIS